MLPTPRALLKIAKLPAILISDPINIRYLTESLVSEGLVLVDAKGFRLFVDSRYTEETTSTARKGVKVVSLTDLPSVLSKQKRCGVEAAHLTVARMERWKKAFQHTTFVPTKGLVEEFRRSKEPDEIKQLRRARLLTKQLLNKVPSLLHVGITEQELAWQLEVMAHEIGGEGLSFPSIVAFGSNTSQPHHHTTSRALKKGELVQIDMGVRVNGYCGDLSEVFFTGPKTPEQEKAHKALLKAKKKATDLVKPGVSSRSLDAAARAVLQEYGIDQAFTHALGHGVGLDVHEGATLSKNGPDTPLLRHEVVTIEPGVYFPGKFGMRLEDMVFVEA